MDDLTIPKPGVPFGPHGVDPDVATAGYLLEVVRKITTGYTHVGGSNVTATVVQLLTDVADALTPLDPELHSSERSDGA